MSPSSSHLRLIKAMTPFFAISFSLLLVLTATSALAPGKAYAGTTAISAEASTPEPYDAWIEKGLALWTGASSSSAVPTAKFNDPRFSRYTGTYDSGSPSVLAGSIIFDTTGITTSSDIIASNPFEVTWPATGKTSSGRSLDITMKCTRARFFDVNATAIQDKKVDWVAVLTGETSDVKWRGGSTSFCLDMSPQYHTEGQSGSHYISGGSAFLKAELSLMFSFAYSDTKQAADDIRPRLKMTSSYDSYYTNDDGPYATLSTAESDRLTEPSTWQLRYQPYVAASSTSTLRVTDNEKSGWAKWETSGSGAVMRRYTKPGASNPKIYITSDAASSTISMTMSSQAYSSGKTNDVVLAFQNDSGGTVSEPRPTTYTVTYHVPDYAFKTPGPDGNYGTRSQEKARGLPLTLIDETPSQLSGGIVKYSYLVKASDGSFDDGSTEKELDITKASGALFESWNSAENLTGKSYAPGAVYADDANLDLYPKYASTHEVTASELPLATRPGYLLAGWFTAEDGGELVGFPGDKPENLEEGTVLYAHWVPEAVACMVRFLSPDGLLIAELPVASGGSADAPAEASMPHMVGMHFTGWDKPLDGIVVDTDITAVYEANVYTVAFDDMHGEHASVEVVHGASVEMPGIDSSKSVDGWLFDGWQRHDLDLTRDADSMLQPGDAFECSLDLENGATITFDAIWHSSWSVPIDTWTTTTVKSSGAVAKTGDIAPISVALPLSAAVIAVILAWIASRRRRN